MAAAMNGMALHGGISLLRHLPGVLGLLPPGDPARRADGQARLHAMTHHDRARRGRSDASAGRTAGGAARNSRICWCSAPATRWKRRMLAARAAKPRPPERAGADAAEPAATSPGFRRHNRCATGGYEIPAADGAAECRCLPPAPNSRSRRKRKNSSPRGAFRRGWSRCPVSSCRGGAGRGTRRDIGTLRLKSAWRPECVRAGTRSSVRLELLSA